MERILCPFGIYFSLGSSFYLPQDLVVHVVTDVPKGINEYIDSRSEGELAGRDFLFYTEQPYKEPWSRVGRLRLASVFSSVKWRKKRNTFLNIIVKI